MTSPGSFGALGPERRHLAKQVHSFRHHAKKLKKIFKETVKVLSDLQDFDESLSIDSILAVDAQKCISNVVSGRTALVVFGETRLKSCIVNEILGEAILPLPWEANEGWRLVHFKYKKHRSMCHTRDGYDLASDKATSHSLPFSRIPREVWTRGSADIGLCIFVCVCMCVAVDWSVCVFSHTILLFICSTQLIKVKSTVDVDKSACQVTAII